MPDEQPKNGHAKKPDTETEQVKQDIHKTWLKRRAKKPPRPLKKRSGKT